jgi:hypothetical protein
MKQSERNKTSRSASLCGSHERKWVSPFATLILLCLILLKLIYIYIYIYDKYYQSYKSNLRPRRDYKTRSLIFKHVRWAREENKLQIRL